MIPLKTPNFYRQRFLLLLLHRAGGHLSKVDFQKLIFLSHQEYDFSYYDFVPYRYGCFSFQAQSDIELMGKFGWLNVRKKCVELVQEPAVSLKDDEERVLSRFLRKMKGLTGRKLIRYVYERYPYYATRSEIAEDILDKQSFEKVIEEKNSLKTRKKMLFTIGYEGLSFENYLNKLIRNDVRLLCDVRKNPLSRKFGFSKGMLSRLLPKFDIEYTHIPELGINSEKRSDLNTESDYMRLFDAYRKKLPDKEASLNTLRKLFLSHKRIALTCFEKRPDLCHRHCISERLYKERGVEVTHL